MKNHIPWRAIRDFSVLMLLILYSVASLRIDSLHQFFHRENIVELHSTAQEKNPCHRSIYHQQSKEGCAHQSHITQNTKCPFCEYKVTTDELFTATQESPNQIQESVYSIPYTKDFSPAPLYAYALRGPPSLV